MVAVLDEVHPPALVLIQRLLMSLVIPLHEAKATSFAKSHMPSEADSTAYKSLFAIRRSNLNRQNCWEIKLTLRMPG